jgi:hypothetical protein
MSELRRLRMLREVGAQPGRHTARIADLVHALGIAALVIFIVAFAGSFPA